MPNGNIPYSLLRSLELQLISDTVQRGKRVSVTMVIREQHDDEERKYSEAMETSRRRIIIFDNCTRSG
jgi:hypothetical protein